MTETATYTPGNPNRAQAEALENRYAKYAMKYANDSGGKIPTDANLAEVLAGCVRSPKPEEYPAIRSHVYTYMDGRESAGRNVRTTLLDRAESYSSDARKFADMAKHADVNAERYVSPEDCKRYAVMYRTIADELRKVAASL